jgi:hypothetical protein
MRELYTSMDSARIGLYKSILDSAGIACYIQNDASSRLLNMIAMVFQPTLCIVDDSRYEEAVALLAPYHHIPPRQEAEWTCGACNELNPETFDLCWNCGALRA